MVLNPEWSYFYEKKKKDTDTQKKDYVHVKTQEEDSHVQAKVRGLRRNHLC